jgi:hypothetical protein
MQMVPERPPVACKLCPSGRQSHANCTRVAASRMQISVNFIHVACDCRPSGYNLHGTSGNTGTNYMRLATSGTRILLAQAASCLQSRQFFASMVREQLFELKNEDAIKKTGNLRNTCAC